MQPSEDIPGEERVGDRDLTRRPRWVQRTVVGPAVSLASWAGANAVLAVVAGLGALAVVLLILASAAIYDAVDEGDGISRWDRPVLDGSIRYRSAGLTRVVTRFTHLGGPLGMTLIALGITVLLTLRWRSRTPLVLMLIGTAGSVLMTTVGKQLVGRMRPPETDAVPPYEVSPSFPSGHTLNSTVVAGLVAYLLLRRLRSRVARVLTVVLAAGWALAMGLSRVFLGHHWLSDVAVGWTLGLAWVGLVVLAHRLFLVVRRSRRVRPGLDGDVLCR